MSIALTMTGRKGWHYSNEAGMIVLEIPFLILEVCYAVGND